MLGDQTSIIIDTASISDYTPGHPPLPSFTGNATLVTFVFKGLAEGNVTFDVSRSTLMVGQPFYGTLYNPNDRVISVVPYVHDVAITNVNTPKTIVGKGYSANITSELSNLGTFTETCNVTICSNAINIANFTNIIVSNRSSTSITFSWTTTDFAYGNYTLFSSADPVLGEIDTEDNNYTSNTPIHVGVPGDISSSTPGVYDGVTNMKDIAYMVAVFNTRPGSPNWNPNADVNNDGVCNMKDIAICVAYFNQHE